MAVPLQRSSRSARPYGRLRRQGKLRATTGSDVYHAPALQRWSVWCILSSLGLFAACPGDSKSTLVAPFFDEVSVTNADGTRLSISAQRADDETYVRTVTLNGRPTNNMTVEHADLRNAYLVFRAS